MSRATFARRFAPLVGQPSLSYLTWWRMTTAARLLRTSDAPPAASAAGVGYTSTFAFSTAFKRRFETAPGIYRRTGAAPRHNRESSRGGERPRCQGQASSMAWMSS
jgi:AraC-like DNA-binding protein